MLIHIYISANVMIKHEKSYSCIQKILSHLIPKLSKPSPKSLLSIFTFPQAETYVSLTENIHLRTGKRTVPDRET